MGEKKKGVDIDYNRLEESEPYLGPGWAVVMLILYLLKRAFPAEQYSPLWWFQVYVLSVVLALTMFTIYKRHRFFSQIRKERTKRRNDGNDIES